MSLIPSLKPIARALLSSGLLAVGFAAVAGPLNTDAEETAVFREPNHFILSNAQMRYTLDENPHPFIDWSLVRAGFVDYINRETGEIVPLSDEHGLDSPQQIEAVPFASPYGLKIEAIPAELGGTFTEELFTIHADFPWEAEGNRVHTLVYDDGDKLYKVWYETQEGLAFATSPDLKTWDRPLKPYKSYENRTETNLLAVLNAEEAASEGLLRSAAEARPGASGAFFIDPSAPADERYKCTFLAHIKGNNGEYAKSSGRPISAMTGGGSTVIFGAVSADGVGWRVLPEPIMLHDADTMTVAKYDTVEEQYVMYTRLYELSRRTVARAETKDFTNWPLPHNVMTPGAEQHPAWDYYATGFSFFPGLPQLRMIFLLTFNRAFDHSNILLATSRDGRVFHLTPGEPIIAQGRPGTVEAGFLVVTPSFVRAPDGRLLCFYNGYWQPHKFPRHKFGGGEQHMAFWPAGRISALVAEEYGEFTTPDLRVNGREIVLNMQADRVGGIQVELRDEEFQPIPGFTFDEADTVYGDHEAVAVSWNGASDISAHASPDKPVYLRFRLRGARLYAISAR